jgi:hypothetical protein
VTLITTEDDQQKSQQSQPIGERVTALLQVVFFAPLTAAV